MRAPLRIAFARPDVASNLISRPGRTIRRYDFRLLVVAKSGTHPNAAGSALERLTTSCVVDVDFRRCSRRNFTRTRTLVALQTSGEV